MIVTRPLDLASGPPTTSLTAVRSARCSLKAGAQILSLRMGGFLSPAEQPRYLSYCQQRARETLLKLQHPMPATMTHAALVSSGKPLHRVSSTLLSGSSRCQVKKAAWRTGELGFRRCLDPLSREAERKRIMLAIPTVDDINPSSAYIPKP